MTADTLRERVAAARVDWLKLANMSATHPAAAAAYEECAKRIGQDLSQPYPAESALRASPPSIKIKVSSETVDSAAAAGALGFASPPPAETGLRCQRKGCENIAELSLCYECADARIERTIKARGLVDPAAITPAPEKGDRS